MKLLLGVLLDLPASMLPALMLVGTVLYWASWHYWSV